MPLEPFDRICPEIARAERHACDVNSPALGVPLGPYVLREFYCTEPGCDCRRVLVQLIPLNDAPLRVVATVNFGWEKAKYYRKWSRDPEIRRWVGRQTTVAQIVNLLYRRLGVGGRRNPPNRVPLGETRRLPTCDTADCQSALLIFRPLGVRHPADSSVSQRRRVR